MNKYKRLTQIVIKQGAICFAIVAIFGGLYYVVDGMVDSSAEKKTAAESAASSEQNEISTLNTQMDKSSVAEKQFITLQAARDNLDFSDNSDILKDWLRTAKTQYRLSNSFKLSLTTGKAAENPAFSGLNYDVIEHPQMKLEFSSISDTHAFSFLQSFVRNAPGLIRIDSISMKRVNDIDTNTISQVKNGAAPYLVETKIEFNWIGLKEKTKDGAAAATGAP